MNVEELLNHEDIKFLPSGRDFVIRCLSPDHEDRNPSLRVDKITGVFNCLSCGFAGNIFAHFGEEGNVLDMRRAKLKSMLKEKIQDSVGLSIPSNAVYYESDWRGISASTIRKFEGFQSLDFPQRLVFPIRNGSGKIVTFCARHMQGGKPKYIFSPEGSKTPLYPSIAKQINGRVILVEGIVDMMNLHDKGLGNAMAAFGVNKLTVDKLNLLKIQGVTGIDIMLDADSAGERATEQVGKLLEKYEMPFRVITDYGADDPGDMKAQQVINLKEHLYGKRGDRRD